MMIGSGLSPEEDKVFLNNLLTEPKPPHKQFIHGGCSVADLHLMAARLCGFFDFSQKTGVCLAVHNKEESGATIFAAVPAHYRALKKYPLSGSTLRLALSSAGMLEKDDSLAFFHNNNVSVVEVYGSTETGGIASRNRSLGEEYFTAFPTVDYRFSHGKLAVKSAYISPDLPLDRDGFFLTADRVEPAGAGFSLRGRSDTVTKVGGKRVDLEEVCNLVKSQPGVDDCVVMVLAEGGGRGSLTGALIEGCEPEPDFSRLKKCWRHLLPLMQYQGLSKMFNKFQLKKTVSMTRVLLPGYYWPNDER